MIYFASSFQGFQSITVERACRAAHVEARKQSERPALVGCFLPLFLHLRPQHAGWCCPHSGYTFLLYLILFWNILMAPYLAESFTSFHLCPAQLTIEINHYKVTQRGWRKSPFRPQSAFVVGQRSSEDTCCVGTIRLSTAVWSCGSLGFAQGFWEFISMNWVNSPAVVSFLNKALWHFGNTFTETSSPEVFFSDTASLFLPPSPNPRPSEASLESAQFLNCFEKKNKNNNNHEDLNRLRKTSD